MPKGRPHRASWLRQVESYLRDMGMGVWRLPGDGQTKAKAIPLQGGRGDALPRRIPPYLSCPTSRILAMTRVQKSIKR